MNLPDLNQLKSTLADAKSTIAKLEADEATAKAVEEQKRDEEREQHWENVEKLISEANTAEIEKALDDLKNRGLQDSDEYKNLKTALVSFYEQMGIPVSEDLR